MSAQPELQNDDVQDFDVRRDQALLSVSEMPSNVVLEGLYKSESQNSAQLQTVLALYDQETARNNGQPSYPRSKTSVKLHIDRMMRTRNFWVRNDVVERGSVTKSQKGKKAYIERKVEECFQWKAHGECSKEDSCSFGNDTKASGNSGAGQRRKDDRLLPHPIRRQRLTARDKNPQKNQATKRKALQTKGAKSRAYSEFVKSRRVHFGILPCVRSTSLKEGVFMVTNAISDMLRPKKSPAKGQRKVVQKDQLRC